MFIRATNPETGGVSPFAVGELVCVHYATDGKKIEGEFNAYKKNVSTQEWELQWTAADYCYSWWVAVDWWYPEGFWKVEFIDRTAGISPSVEFIVGTPPVPPLCAIGEQQILEVCSDGVTPKRWECCLPAGYVDKEIVETYRGAVLYKREGVHYDLYCFQFINQSGNTYEYRDKWLGDAKREIDLYIDQYSWTFPAGEVWIEYEQDCEEEELPVPPAETKVTFVAKCSGEPNVAGVTITVIGVVYVTGADGMVSFMAEDGKSYRAVCVAPTGYECVVCDSNFTAPKSYVSFVLKAEEPETCGYGDIKPNSTIYCSDGVTWKFRKICDAHGNWKFVTNRCSEEEEDPEEDKDLLYPIFDFVENMLGVDRKTAEMATYFGIVGLIIVALGAMLGKK